MKAIMNWVKDLFDSSSTTSSKRFGGLTLLFWSMIMGSYYILKVQMGGTESNTTVSVLEFGIVSGVGLLAGGTLAESVGRGTKKITKKDDESQ